MSSQLSWSPTATLRKALRIFLPISLALTIYLYLFPFFGKCAFPLPPVQHNAPADTGYHAFLETVKLHLSLPPVPVDESDPTSTPAVTPSRPLAPFRLLALGDPQLEGDTSIPTEYLGVFPHAKNLFRHLTFQTSHASLRWRLRQCVHEIVDIFFEDVFDLAESYRKRFDHWDNDYYLAHIYRTLHCGRARPTSPFWAICLAANGLRTMNSTGAPTVSGTASSKAASACPTTSPCSPPTSTT